MNEPAAASVPPEGVKLIEIWAESLAQVLGQVSGAAFPCAVSTEPPAELAAAAESDLWIVCACSGGLRGEMSLRLSAPSTARLAQILMGETPAAEVSPEGAAAVQPVSAEHREAALELLRQVAGLIASVLKPQWGEVQLRLEPATGASSWPSSLTSWIRAGENPSLPLEVHLSAALVAALRAEKSVTAQPAAPEASAAAPLSAQPSAPRTASNHSKVSLELLMDVELVLTLRFGSRSLPLSEILDLNPGSVIELDRQVDDPVDVLLDGRVVARGEVVVMDGNYGLRVTEIGPASGA